MYMGVLISVLVDFTQFLNQTDVQIFYRRSSLRDEKILSKKRVYLPLPLENFQSSLEENTPVAVMVSLHITPLYGLWGSPLRFKAWSSSLSASQM